MAFLLLILLVLIILAILLFRFAARVRLVFNTVSSEMAMTLLWLDPFIKAYVTRENSNLLLKVYLFNRLVSEKRLNGVSNRHQGMELVRLSSPQDIHVNVRYGFSDPFMTGIACGAINIASQLINVDFIDQAPDFVSTEDYIHLDATARVNLGSTLVRLIKRKTAQE